MLSSNQQAAVDFLEDCQLISFGDESPYSSSSSSTDSFTPDPMHDCRETRARGWEDGGDVHMLAPAPPPPPPPPPGGGGGGGFIIQQHRPQACLAHLPPQAQERGQQLLHVARLYTQEVR